MSETTSLAIFERASVMLAEANTIQKAKELKSIALTAADWAKRKGMGEEAVQHCRAYALDAERKMGEMLASVPLNGGTKGQLKGKTSGGAIVLPPEQAVPTLAELGLTKRDSAEAQQLAALPTQVFEEVRNGSKTRAKAKREVKKAKVIAKLKKIAATEPKIPTGKFDVLVIDPPWPIQKIERDCRPNQSLLDYPTMTVEEISALSLPQRFAAKDCHVFLWTTHKYLPSAFDILKTWGAEYSFTLVWHKPGGFQPVGLPQFNCEFVLYGRIGSPIFIDTKVFPTCFNAERGKHSEKPEDFYALLRRVTAGRRLDYFNRREIEGFIGAGKEAA